MVVWEQNRSPTRMEAVNDVANVERGEKGGLTMVAPKRGASLGGSRRNAEIRSCPPQVSSLRIKILNQNRVSSLKREKKAELQKGRRSSRPVRCSRSLKLVIRLKIRSEMQINLTRAWKTKGPRARQLMILIGAGSKRTGWLIVPTIKDPNAWTGTAQHGRGNAWRANECGDKRVERVRRIETSEWFPQKTDRVPGC